MIANAVNVDTLDPAANSVNESIWLDQNIYQPSAPAERERHRRASRTSPRRGTSPPTASPTPSTSGDDQFSDGSPVTAEDVRYSIERSIHYDGGWGFLLDAVKSVEAPDPQDGRGHAQRPHAPLLADLAMYAYAVLPEKLVKAQGAKTFFQHPIGSGAFMVTQWNKGSELDVQGQPALVGTKPNFTTSRS